MVFSADKWTETTNVLAFAALKQPITVDKVVSLFEKYGPVTFVRLSRNPASKKPTGMAFVEFKNEDDRIKYVFSSGRLVINPV